VGLDRVEVDVWKKNVKMPLPLHLLAFETAAKKRPITGMAVIVALGKTASNFPHYLRKTGANGPEEQVKVIGHERVGMQLKIKSRKNIRDNFQEKKTVVIAPKNWTVVQPTIHHVMPSSREVNAYLAGHSPI
jgi:hypothetical protein